MKSLAKRSARNPLGLPQHVDTGVQFIRDNPVDGAVVDIDLNGTASFPICEQLQKRDIPFVFLTGYDRPYPVPQEFRQFIPVHAAILAASRPAIQRPPIHG